MKPVIIIIITIFLSAVMPMTVMGDISFEGDVNADGTVNIQDCIALGRYLADMGNEAVAVDVNLDGSADITDMVILMQYLTTGDFSLFAIPEAKDNGEEALEADDVPEEAVEDLADLESEDYEILQETPVPEEAVEDLTDLESEDYEILQETPVPEEDVFFVAEGQAAGLDAGFEFVPVPEDDIPEEVEKDPYVAAGEAYLAAVTAAGDLYDAASEYARYVFETAVKDMQPRGEEYNLHLAAYRDAITEARAAYEKTLAEARAAYDAVMGR